MTATQARPQPEVVEVVAARSLRRSARPAPSQALRISTGTLTLAAAVLLGFGGYLFGLSGSAEAHFQHTMFASFKKSLGEAVAPIGPTTVGNPVAILDIPAIGIHHLVIVEGTDARTTTRGPGHRRDTPLPGQAGVSVVLGRRATFGAPFAKLLDLQAGSQIQVTTGQGVARYVVSSFGTSSRPAPANSANRLVLSTAGAGLSPDSTVSVSADLRGTVQAAGALPAIAPDEKSLSGAGNRSLLPLALWAQLLLVLSIAATVAAQRWAQAPAWFCLAPAALAVLWNVFENAATLLPNVL